jgi:uncharacterized OB-fold protein
LTQRPLPEITQENRHFWQGGADNKLQFLHCPGCNYYLHPPGPVCPLCYQRSLQVKAVSGRAIVASYSINYQQWMPQLEVPYVVAIVELVEQPSVRLTTNIVNCDPQAVRIGMEVRVVFEQVEDVYLPLFEPA